VSGLGYEFHIRLEEIHVKPHQVINSLQTIIGRLRGISVIAYDPPHSIPVFLLHITAIILLVGTRSGEYDMPTTAIIIEMLVDKLTTVIGV
jgi:hypothetical protein